MRRAAVLLAGIAAAAAFAAPADAGSGRLSVEVAAGTNVEALARSVEDATGGRLVARLGRLDSLVFSVRDPDRAAVRAGRVSGVRSAERMATDRRLAFVPNDPFASDQWYLNAIRAFAFWPDLPVQPPVRVAVVDSGIDGGHPELSARIVASRSFVAGAARTDALGHGTAVAGEIAAALDDGRGIAGVGIPVRLVVAKVARPDGSIPVLAEARAIRWAVDAGARVINLSLGAPRDPTNPRRDGYSTLEHAAIDYATKHGVLVVAAAGNCLRLPCPERYAAYPAALPHVIGVGALAPSGATPWFSNRDRAFVDLAAPGVKILSTFPRKLSRSGCARYGYTPCAREEAYRSPAGTSFSAPLVTAAAAVLIGEQARLGLPALHSSQVAAVVERSAKDIGPSGRDARSGNGRLDVAAAVQALGASLPPADRREPNDRSGYHAVALSAKVALVEATLDRFDDPRDVYRIRLGAGRRIVLTYSGPDAALYLRRPGGRLVRVSRTPGPTERIAFRPKRAGRFFVDVRLPSGRGGAYTLTLARS